VEYFLKFFGEVDLREAIRLIQRSLKSPAVGSLPLKPAEGSMLKIFNPLPSRSRVGRIVRKKRKPW
jgi:hypothetical protein